MKNQINCTHNPCLKGQIVSEYLNESETLYSLADSCDSCLKELMAFEASLYLSRNSEVISHADKEYNDFQETIDLHKAELMISQEKNNEIPDYLKKYMEISFDRNKDESVNSVIVKMTKKGIKFVDSLIDNLTFIPSLNYVPLTRSIALDDVNARESFIVLEEKLETGIKVTYQVIQKSQSDAFLSIKVESVNPEEIFLQANLRKDGRLLQSIRFNQDNTVNFARLQEGKYNIELSSDKNSKKIDFIILID